MNKARILSLLALLACFAALTGPALLTEGIFPWDGAIYAATGACWLSAFQDLPGFVSRPLQWLYEYYDQYPAVALRRHPPLFGIAEAGVYALTGVSVFGARLTVWLFGLVFALGVYYTCLRFWGSEVVALGSAVAAVATPEILSLINSVWLDIPALAFAVWVFYFYARRVEVGASTWRPLLFMVLFATLALYTYQLPVFLFAGIALHLLARERRTFYRDKKLIVCALLFVLAMLPLALQTLYLARDNLRAAGGSVQQGWEAFVPVQDKWSLAFWGYYGKVLATRFPFQFFGLLLWALSLVWRRPSAAELLFAICFALGYLAFSQMPSKGTRYAVYIALPATPLAVLALWDLCHTLAPGDRPVLRGCIGLALLGVAVAQPFLIDARCPALAGMGRPVEAILARQPNARILYSGPLDSAFVYYVRQADPSRQARVSRATVQLTDARALKAFLEKENIGFLVFEETDEGPLSALYRPFRDEIRTLVRESKAFTSMGRFEMSYGVPGKLRTCIVSVYGPPTLESPNE
jgi:4-amino-4-deoxy-L-arabinose transferase-like glycosyltransferase